MKLLIKRTMRLGGERYEAGEVADVPKDEAELALRHGWAATPAPAPEKKAGKAKAESTDEASGD